MHTRSIRRTATVLVLATLVATTAGCQTVKAGTRCRADAGTARDATHVMTCVKGRWTRLMTIGQAAQAILSLQPSFIEGYSAGTTVVVGSSTPGTIRAHVLRGNSMAPAVGAAVTFTMPTSGPGGSIIGSATAQTDANGIAQVQYAPNTIAGSFNATASVGAVAPIEIRLANHADLPDAIELVSGAGQSTVVSQAFPAQFVARIVDQFGNPLVGEDLAFGWDETLVDITEYVGPSDHLGIVRFSAVGVGVGQDAILVGVELPSGDFVINAFPFTVTA